MTPHHGKFVSYLRVSTKRQGQSGLGLEAQRTAVTNYLDGGRWKLIKEYVEVESGKRNHRPMLQQALTDCRLYRATLVIAKLDRLSRDAHFLLGLEKAGVEFVAVDMPNANKLTVGIMAMVAQQEREFISDRTKKALAEAKAKGKRIGQPKGTPVQSATMATRRKGAAVNKAKADEFAERLRPVLTELKHLSANATANELNGRGVATARQGRWNAQRIITLKARMQLT
jgi:DNA invertase Pin-like site-specific DNA recombinase